MINAVQLRMARVALGMSVRELAHIAEIDKNTISRCESGARVMSDSLEKLERVLTGLGIMFIGEDDGLGPGVRMRKVEVSGARQRASSAGKKGLQRKTRLRRLE